MNTVHVTPNIERCASVEFNKCFMRVETFATLSRYNEIPDSNKANEGLRTVHLWELYAFFASPEKELCYS